MMLNFKVVMVADGLAARDDTFHNASLTAFYSNFGDVQTVDEVLESLDRGKVNRPEDRPKRYSKVDYIIKASGLER
jgi:hypothetical protein